MKTKSIRETKIFRAEESKRGVRVTCKLARHDPKSRVVSRKEWDGYLSTLNDREFNGACVLEIGVGLYAA